MCSAFMLPQDPEERRAIYAGFSTQKASLHLVLENAVIAGPEGVAPVEEILQIIGSLPACPTFVPAELLPDLRGLGAYTGDDY